MSLQDSAPPLDILAIAPHPDDAELFCGGLLAKMAQLGYRVGILDLTRGEKASRGTADLRAQEASRAAQVLGVAWRGNLGLPDCGLLGDDPTQTLALVEQLRLLRPELVLAPWQQERHPDHRAAAQLADRACFLAGLRNFPQPDQPLHRIRQLLFYPMRVEARPSFVVDIEPFAELKRQAIACHASQVGQPQQGAVPLVAASLALPALAHRDGYYGAQIGSAAGEPYISPAALSVADPLALFRGRPGVPHFFPEGP